MTRILDLNHLSLDQVRALESVIDEIKPDFHALISSLYDRTGRSIFWDVNSLLSRSNYTSDLFQDLCGLELARQAVVTGAADKVIVRNPGQKKVLDAYFRKLEMKIPVKCPGALMSVIGRIGKPIYDVLRNIQWSLAYLKQKNRNRRQAVPKDRPLILVDTFFSTYIFKSGEFKDRYYTGLLDHLTPEQEAQVFFVPNVISWRKIGRMTEVAAAAREQFIYFFDFLKLRDYLFAVSAPIAIKRIPLWHYRFRDMPIGPVLKADFRKHIAQRSAFRGILFFCFFRRLKQAGICLHLVVDWFENQMVDRGFNKGKNTFYPDTPSVGYQGLIAAYKWHFQVQPTQAEARAKVIPDTLAVTGKGLTGIARQFHPDLDVMVAPGLRFSDIHDIPVKEPDRFSDTNPVILAALPIWVEDSLDILGLLVHVLDRIRETGATVKIKPHPSLDFDAVKSAMPSWPRRFTVMDGNFVTAVQTADLLISSGSTVCMEAIAYGIPVIVIGSRTGVTKNVIPDTVSKQIWDLCYTPDEFSRALDRLCFDLTRTDRQAFARLARQVRDDFFCPVSDHNVRQMLKLASSPLDRPGPCDRTAAPATVPETDRAEPGRQETD
jgi:hypothetical protein